MDEKDKQAFAALMVDAPAPGEVPVSEERRLTVETLEAEHQSVRLQRDRVARDAEWGE